MLYYNHQKEVRPDLLKVTDSQPQKGHGEYYEGTYEYHKKTNNL